MSAFDVSPSMAKLIGGVVLLAIHQDSGVPISTKKNHHTQE